ncbi:MAG: hypothetical protein HY690_17830 [Chloroflexi bacterium]|nr:hypothetical protein [Chloroflexota bacterium]
MSGATPASLRVAVVGGGPAGSFFALYALKYAALAGRDLAITLYEGKDFRQFGQAGCNMCAGIIPASVLSQFGGLGLTVPPELILSRISTYSLHTSAGSLDATQPDPRAEIVSVYRGAGPRYGHPPGLVSFDELLLEQAVARGARLRRGFVQAVRRGPMVEVESGGESERYDLVVLASGVNGHSLCLGGFAYRPPPAGAMCQTELYLGQDEVQRRLGGSVHIFLPPDCIATYGILIPKGPFVTVSLLRARSQMRSLRQFLALEEVRAVLGAQARPACGCLPSISVGLATSIADEGFVAVGDASATRLYKNGIGSALATAQRAAWTAVYRGCTRDDFETHYLPLCRGIDRDNRIGRLLFLEVPALKRFGVMPRAHYRLATSAQHHQGASELHARILWGMFTGAYSYRDLLRMATSPALLSRLALAFGSSLLRPKECLPSGRC